MNSCFSETGNRKKNLFSVIFLRSQLSSQTFHSSIDTEMLLMNIFTNLHCLKQGKNKLVFLPLT